MKIENMSRIAFNLAFIDSGPLTGPGYYAVQLLENILHDFKAHNSKFELIAYVQASAVHHFSTDAQSFIRKIPSLNGRVSRVLYEQFALPIVCIRERIDLLFSPAFVSPVWGAKRLVATICDMYYRVVPEVTEPFQRKYWNVMIPVTGYVCDRIITISENSKIDIEAYIPSARGKTVSIPLASRFEVPDAGNEPKALARRPVVLMVANLTPNKNCAVVVEAVSMLRKKGRDVSFVHAGKDHLGLLQKSIEVNDARSFVSSLGKVSDEELAQLYKTSLAVVVPSLYEGFGMPAVEAQAMGAPLICSDRGALPEAAGSGAIYFDPEEPAMLAQKIEEVMDLSIEDRGKMVAAGYDSVRRFSWAKTARETMDVFDMVLAKT